MKADHDPVARAFELLGRDASTRARRGRLRTAHGTVETPAFMPVGTYGAVKAMAPWELEGLGAEMILSNAYHLELRPGSKHIARLGGLHRFMGWDGPMLTDSGGFQVFSLAEMNKITDDGVRRLKSLQALEYLALENCPLLTKQAVEELRRALPNCSILH